MGSYQHSYSQVSQYLQDDENGDFTIDASTPRVNESSCQLDQSRMVSRSTQRWITAFAIAVILSVAVVVRQYTRDDPTSNSTKNQNYNDDTSDHHSKLFDKFGENMFHTEYICMIMFYVIMAYSHSVVTFIVT